MRKIRFLFVAIESELQHGHPGQTGRSSQITHFLADQAQILGQEGEVGKPLAGNLPNFIPGPLRQAPIRASFVFVEILQ